MNVCVSVSECVCTCECVCVSECAPSCSKRIISLTYACARVGDLRCVKIFFFCASFAVFSNHVTDCTITDYQSTRFINPLNPELNPICYLLALLGAHHFLHVSRIRVKLLTFILLMSYIYGAPILDVSRSHTTTQHSR